MLEEGGEHGGRGSCPEHVGRGSEQVQGREQQKRGLQMQRFTVGMKTCTQEQKVQNTKVVRGLLGRNLRNNQRVQLAASAKHA